MLGAAGILKTETYTPLRLLQASPMCYWLKENHEDLRNLARFFTVHHCSPGEVVPASPFYFVATGLFQAH